MKWDLEITAHAESDIDRLDSQVARRVRERLTWFAENFDIVIHSPLTGDRKGSFKLRVGDWRIAYEIDNIRKLAIILRVEHRSKSYKKRR